MNATDEPTAPPEPTGLELATSWRHRQHVTDGHPLNRPCPRCSQTVSRTGITELVYTFEVCTCSIEDYAHLLETVWHRMCFVVSETERGES